MDRFLRVDVGRLTAVVESVPEKYQKVGGRSLIAKLLLDEVKPTCEPLGKNNKLILATGLLAGTGVLLGLSLGRERIFALILGGYISFALMSVLSPQKLLPDLFDKEENFVALVVVFLILVGLAYFVLARSIFRSAIKRKNKAIVRSLILGVFLVGILTSFVFSFFPKDLLSAFTKTVKDILNTPTSRLLWMVAPLIFLGIFKGRGSKTNN